MRNILVLSLLGVTAASQAADSFNLLGLAPQAGTLALSGILNNTYSAGPFNASLNGGPSMEVYCADLGHSAAYNSPMTVNVVDTSTLGSGYQLAAQILNKHFASADTALERAALQGAIWRSIYGNSISLNDGTSGAAALAESYLTEDLTGYSTSARYYDLGSANQSMMGVQSVPEPASIAALGVGALGVLKRRKKA